MATTSDIIIAENVCKSYKTTIALDNASLRLKKGEILALLGPNGAGKTTLIKILSTLLLRDSGNITILGADIDNDENEIRHILGYVGQDTERSAYARLTALENLRFFGALRGLSNEHVDEQVGRFSQYVDFDDNLEKQFMHLSGGQKQSVVIMRSLLHNPPIIILDEPTKGLDPIIARKTREWLRNYARSEGKSILLTTHILTEVDEMADRAALIHKGKIPIIDTPSQLKSALGVTDIIELKKQDLPDTTKKKLMTLDCVVSVIDDKEDWLTLGISDLFDCMEVIIATLRKDNVRTGFQHRAVSMEDAFIHHVGVFEESFTK